MTEALVLDAIKVEFDVGDGSVCITTHCGTMYFLDITEVDLLTSKLQTWLLELDDDL